MFCHKQGQESLFKCKSHFVPQEDPSVEVPFEAPSAPTYLPGERLLIKLGKERKKKEKKIDVERIAESLGRVLSGF
jgi:hypothetical protein